MIGDFNKDKEKKETKVKKLKKLKKETKKRKEKKREKLDLNSKQHELITFMFKGLNKIYFSETINNISKAYKG